MSSIGTNFKHRATVRREVDAIRVTLASVLSGTTVTINGVEFTAHSSTTTLAARQFSVAGGNAAAAAQLLLCINSTAYGVPGVIATRTDAIITVTGSATAETVTITASATTIAVATRDAHGKALKAWTIWASNVPCLHARLTGRELMGAVLPAIGNYRTMFRIGVDLNEKDHILIDGKTFEIKSFDPNVSGFGRYAEAMSVGVNPNV